MKLYSYVVARDYGFAPNPFYGSCTLATCKPGIREQAQLEDWIVGTGSKSYALDGRLVYAFKVDQILTFDQYWTDVRFIAKRPNLTGSLKQAFGDNIYHRRPNTRKWLQENSHHSLPNGRPNPHNVEHDTKADRVLIGTEYVYFGGEGPRIPKRFRGYQGFDVCCQHPGYKCNFPDDLVASFIAWIQSRGVQGYQSRPAEWDT